MELWITLTQMREENIEVYQVCRPRCAMRRISELFKKWKKDKTIVPRGDVGYRLEFWTNPAVPYNRLLPGEDII
jgi:hypothetical protein